MIREAIGALAFASTVLGASRASAAEPSPAVELAFVVDPRFGMESGAISVESTRQLFVWSAARVPSPFPTDERSSAGRVLGVFLRGAELVLLDVPLVEVETGVVHEVFGHGARAREYGASVSYIFKLPRPYRWILAPDDTDPANARTDVQPGPHHADYDLPVNFGGIEANYLVAHRIARDVVWHRGLVHQSDLLVYSASKLVYMPSFLGPNLDEVGGDDVANYIHGLQDRFDRWRPEDGPSVAGQLRAAYLWNLADPLLLYAAYATLVPWLGRGESVTRAPVPHIGGTTVLPLPRFNLTPFGAEHLLGVMVSRDTWVSEAYGRVGSSGLASYVGAGVSVDGVRLLPTLRFGFDLDGWRQPELLLRERNTYDRVASVGGNAALRATWMAAGRFGLTGKLAVKSRGYLAGQPIDAGVYGWAGIAVDLPSGEP